MKIPYSSIAKSSLRRVLHVTPSLSLGGTEKAAQLFATYLNKEYFNVAVWSPSNGPRADILKNAGIPVWVNIPLEAVLYRFKPHIVHLHRAGWPEPKLMRSFRGTHWFHHGVKLPKIIETNVFGRHDPSHSGRMIDKTLFVSHFCAERFSNTYKKEIPSNRYDVLYNPVDVMFIAKHTTPPEKKNFRNAVIGRLSRADKGKWSISFGLHIIPTIISQIPDLQYYIVGGIQEAYDFVTTQDLSNNISFLPEITTELELANYLDKLSIFVHANDTGESFGLSIAEAMSAGLPIITHPCLNLKDNAQTELVEHGVTGLVATTPKEYADFVTMLLKNPDVAQRMGIAGQKKAFQLFDVSLLTHKLEHIYHNLCPPDFACAIPS